MTPPAGGGLPLTLGCPACGGPNQAGMNFCRHCGSSMAGAIPPMGGGTSPTPPGGTPRPPMALAPTPVAPPPAGPYPVSPPMVARTAFAPSGPNVPMAGPGSGPMAASRTCRRCGGQTPSGFAFCQHCGTPFADGPAAAAEAVAQTLAASPSAPVAAPIAAVATPIARPPSQAGRWGALVAVRRDGSDGDRYPLAGEYVAVGREGDLRFDDRYLAPQHARVELAQGVAKVVPLDEQNGVFRRLRGPVTLSPGTILLIGRELLRYEPVDADERDVVPLLRFGVALFGSPPRKPWARLLQILPNGGVRDVRHLWGTEAVVGREEGDLVFRDDEFLSRRHAVLRPQGSQCVLEDLKSSNGTFIRLRGPTVLEPGDVLRMGDQMFRFEPG